MDKVFYAELELVCACVLMCITLNKRYNSLEGKTMHHVYMCEVLFFAADAVAYCLNGSSYPCWISYAVNIFYFLTAVAGPLLWCYYVAASLDKKISRKARLALQIPIALFTFFALTDPIHKALFFIDGAGVYNRGVLYPVQPVLSLIYVVIASVIVLFSDNRASYYARSMRVILLSYPAIMILAVVCEISFTGIPVLCPLITIGFVVIYLSSQNRIISRDALTGMNNIYEYRKYIYEKIKTGMYLMLLDIDRFKMINDLYGHAKGDEVLKQIAKVIEEVSGEYGVFCARYGGDEFVLIDPKGSLDRAKEIQEKLYEQAGKISVEGKALEVSLGYVCCDLEHKSMKELFTDADIQMYIEKERHKAQRTA